MEEHVLFKQIQHDGETITKIVMELDDLSVTDLERCEREARKLSGKKVITGVLEFNKHYQACVAAKAAGLPVHVIRSLGGRDYTQVCLLVQNFLLGGELDEDEETNPETPESPQGETGKTASSPKTPKNPQPPSLTESNPT